MAEILKTSLDSASLLPTEHRLGSQAACQNCHITLSEGTIFKTRQQQLIKDKVVALFFCFSDSPVQKAPGLMLLSWLLFILMVGAKQATLPQAWDRQHIGNIGLRQKEGAHWTPFLVGFL